MIVPDSGTGYAPTRPPPGVTAGCTRPFAAATTGPANLAASAVLRDTRHLDEYLTGELARLPGLTPVQTAPIIRTLKRTRSVH